MLAVHYYLLFNGSDGMWHHMKTFYMEKSAISFLGNVFVGQSDIFDTLSNIRKKLTGDRPRERIVHVVEKLHCRAHGEAGIAIRVSSSFIVGNQFLIFGEGLQAEGMPSLEELSINIPSKPVGQFREEFIIEPGSSMGCYYISRVDSCNNSSVEHCTTTACGGEPRRQSVPPLVIYLMVEVHLEAATCLGRGRLGAQHIITDHNEQPSPFIHHSYS